MTKTTGGSFVLAGNTFGEFAAVYKGGYFDFAAVKIDRDGEEVWRWQVRRVVQTFFSAANECPCQSGLYVACAELTVYIVAVCSTSTSIFSATVLVHELHALCREGPSDTQHHHLMKLRCGSLSQTNIDRWMTDRAWQNTSG